MTKEWEVQVLKRSSENSKWSHYNTFLFEDEATTVAKRIIKCFPKIGVRVEIKEKKRSTYEYFDKQSLRDMNNKTENQEFDFRSKRPKGMISNLYYHTKSHSWSSKISGFIVDTMNEHQLLPGEPGYKPIPPELQREWKVGDKFWHYYSNKWKQYTISKIYDERVYTSNQQLWKLQTIKERAIYIGNSIEEEKVLKEEEVREEPLHAWDGRYMVQTLPAYYTTIGDNSPWTTVSSWNGLDAAELAYEDKSPCWDGHLRIYDRLMDATVKLVGQLVDISNKIVEAEKERGKANIMSWESQMSPCSICGKEYIFVTDNKICMSCEEKEQMPIVLDKGNTPPIDETVSAQPMTHVSPEFLRSINWTVRGEKRCKSCGGPTSTINGTRECVLNNCLSIKDKEENKPYKAKLCKRCGATIGCMCNRF